MLPLANHPTVHCLLRRCKPLLDQGQSLSHAMHAAGIINVAQRQQLEAAIPNGRASRCLEQIRRQQLRSAARRQRWLRVLVLPTVYVTVAILVTVLGISMIEFLATFVSSQSA
ncbi:MAG: type II secretion system F family protein, partial [Planctomycetota bacterium]